MFIQPDSTVIVCQNVPLEPTYDHTINWAGKGTEAQEAYFRSKALYTFDKQTYQRSNKNKIRIEKKADDLYLANYLCFRNTAYGTKWFYAFITAVDYVNDLVSEITYEIDVMQTWGFSFRFEECFIEREHPAQDIVGDNLVPENLELGDYVSNGINYIPELQSTYIIVATTFDNDLQDFPGGLFGGLYSGLYFHKFSNDDEGAMLATNFIQKAAAKSDGIVAVFLAPRSFAANLFEKPRELRYTTERKITGDIDGYTPKCNKLYTYPYNFLYVTNFQGNGATFPYEYFNSESCEFTLFGDMTPSPEVILMPRNYKGVEINLDERMTLNGYPQLSFNTDTFKTWLGQNAATLAISALGVATDAGMGIKRANIMNNSELPSYAKTGAIVSAATGALSMLAQVVDHSVLPNQARGSAGGSALAALNLLNYGFMNKHIRFEFAKRIDDFFNAFGYAVNKIGVPDNTNRPEWNYVKTAGCHIRASAPADVVRKICEIHDRGITYWKNPDHIGNYSFDNPAPIR